MYILNIIYKYIIYIYPQTFYIFVLKTTFNFEIPKDRRLPIHFSTETAPPPATLLDITIAQTLSS